MNHSLAILLSFLIGSLVAPSAARGDGQTKPPRLPSRQDVLSAKTPDEAGPAYRAFFQDRDPQRLRALLNDPDASISLYAAWELCLNPNRDQIPPHPQRFFGFLEGRAGATPPLEWEVAAAAKCFPRWPYQQGQLPPAVREYLPLCPWLADPLRADAGPAKTDLGLYAPAGTSLKREGGRVAVTVGGKTVRIRGEVLRGLREAAADRSSATCAALLGRDRSFLAVYDEFGNQYRLVCVDSASGEVLWEAKVWALGQLLGVKSGLWFQQVSLILNERAVVVLGQCVGHPYAEAFDVDKGTAVFRFASNYYWCPDEEHASRAGREPPEELPEARPATSGQAEPAEGKAEPAPAWWRDWLPGWRPTVTLAAVVLIAWAGRRWLGTSCGIGRAGPCP